MVKIKHKVTIKKKTEQEEQPVVAPNPVVTEPSVPEEPISYSSYDDGEPSGKGKKKWLAAALAGLLVVGGGGAGAYYLSQKDKDNPPVEQTSDDEGSGSIVENSDGTEINDATAENVPEQSNGEEVAGQGEKANEPTAQKDGNNNPQAKEEAPSATGQNNDTGGKAQTKEPQTQPASDTEKPSTPISATAPTQQPKPEKTSQVSKLSNASGTIEEEAKNVIRGDYGCGLDRKKALGDRYKEIQRKVNEMYRKGLVKRH